MAQTSHHIRLLLVDFLDSYTYNLPAFIRNAASHISQVAFDIIPYTQLCASDVSSAAQSYHGIILSAGPGTVEDVNDIGDFTTALLSSNGAVPVFGICLGFQAICQAFGGTIKRLNTPHHGIISEILDMNLQPLGRRATRYHSLEVHLDAEAQRLIEPLAVARNLDDQDCCCLMEARHMKLPLWAVQYHPESIYSDNCEVTTYDFLYAACAQTVEANNYFRGYLDPLCHRDGPGRAHENGASSQNPTQDISWHQFQIDQDFWDFVKPSCTNHSSLFLLDSSFKSDWSFCSDPGTARIFRYSLRTRNYTWAEVAGKSGKEKGDLKVVESHQASLEEVWRYLKHFSSNQRFENGPSDVPFWGGFLGWFSYELGLAHLGIDAHPTQAKSKRAGVALPQYDDIQLAWSINTIAFYRPKQMVYAMSLSQDREWLQSLRHRLGKPLEHPLCKFSVPSTEVWRVMHPDERGYTDRILEAQEYIKAGESYELCLTGPSRINQMSTLRQSTHDPHDEELTRRKTVSSGDKDTTLGLYESLRNTSPSSFMSCIISPETTILSASPELFLSFDASIGRATMKPIKGTLGKFDDQGRKVAITEARKALSVPKVIAENLMIVDLVRNDLAKVSTEVQCPSLMHVEEIETMYQLVSTVEAKIHAETTAWDLLQCSLPPGSMTGAPKLRSCQILQKLENWEPRGLYSGVVGYIDVRGNCQTSVSIRNAVRYSKTPSWRVGAGGAITNLSDAVDEWQERQLKCRSVERSVLPAFKVLETVLWQPELGFRRWPQHVTRLMSTLQKFQFQMAPVLCDLDNILPVGSEVMEVTTKSFSRWIQSRISDELKSRPLRVSINVSHGGNVELATKPINGPSQSSGPKHVRLDPDASRTSFFEPFVRYKTSYRELYDSARRGAGARDDEEVLLFRPKDHSAFESWKQPNETDQDENIQADRPIVAGRCDDLLTEGSCTNVAVYSSVKNCWITPQSECLRGIECEAMVESGELTFGRIQRAELKAGTMVRLMNSVRGWFSGLVV